MRISGRVTTAHGSFYDGTKTDLIYTGRVTILPQLAVEPGMTINWVDLPFCEFTSRLLNARVIVTPTPRMVVSSLIQYNALPHSLSSSVRLRWEYRPGSTVFVVWQRQQDGEVGIGEGDVDKLHERAAQPFGDLGDLVSLRCLVT